MSEKTYLVVGLGNIGAEYATTRHNIGFIILDAWAQASNISFTPDRYGEIALIKDKGRKFYLLKPSTYMNLSGNAVRYWIQKLDIDFQSTIIICDDVNLPFETIRMRKAGSDGGHNGLKNICELLGTPAYPRIRVGVGHDYEQGRQIQYVLGSFSEEECKVIPTIAKKIIEGVRTWAFVGADKAMTSLNIKPKKEDNA